MRRPLARRSLRKSVRHTSLVDALGEIQRRALHRCVQGLLTLARGQVGRAEEPVHPQGKSRRSWSCMRG